MSKIPSDISIFIFLLLSGTVEGRHLVFKRNLRVNNNNVVVFLYDKIRTETVSAELLVLANNGPSVPGSLFKSIQKGFL